MRITELLVENQQQLDEGPLGSLGKAAGKAVGGVAKGVGAVAGGVAGLGSAFKKGFQTGKATVAGDEDPNAEAPTTASDINAQGPKGTAAAKAQTGAAAQAINKTAQATAGANPEQTGQTVYAQVKSQINNLDKKGKQRILQLLQKSLAQPAAQPAAKTAAAPAQQPAAAPAAAAAPASEPVTPFGSEPAPADQAQAAPAPAAKKTRTKKAAAPAPEQPAAEPAAQTAPAQQPAVEPAPKKKRGSKKAAQPSQAEIDADRERVMGPTSDSIIRTGNNLSETLAQRILEHKQRQVKEGQVKIFR